MTLSPAMLARGAARKVLGEAQVVHYSRHFYHHIPSGARCKECHAPFKGPFSVPFRFLQIRPSRKNPNLCTM